MGRQVDTRNDHAAAPDQRFPYDFVIAREGHTRDGDPSRKQSHFCFGEPVFAPQSGRSSPPWMIPDSPPGRMNEEQPPGNPVIVDHGNGEYSVLAHLQNGSVQPRPGQSVRQGDRLGRCGNSGRPSEPHLHHHLQTAGAFGKR